jgi:hypothetical protein
MYSDAIISMDVAKQELAQASRKAEEAWRFRHFKSVEARVLDAILKGALGVARSALALIRAKPAVGSAQEQLSY